LVNIVPTVPVKQMGADIVVGINVSGARFIYEHKLPLWRRYRALVKLLGIQYGKDKLRMIKDIILKRFNWESFDTKQLSNPGIIKIMTQALDHSMRISDQWTDADMACDVMITPQVKQYRKAEFSELDKIYEEGRRSALEALPKIKRAIAEYESQQIKELIK